MKRIAIIAILLTAIGTAQAGWWSGVRNIGTQFARRFTPSMVPTTAALSQPSVPYQPAAYYGARVGQISSPYAQAGYTAIEKPSSSYGSYAYQEKPEVDAQQFSSPFAALPQVGQSFSAAALQEARRGYSDSSAWSQRYGEPGAFGSTTGGKRSLSSFARSAAFGGGASRGFISPVSISSPSYAGPFEQVRSLAKKSVMPHASHYDNYDVYKQIGKKVAPSLILLAAILIKKGYDFVGTGREDSEASRNAIYALEGDLQLFVEMIDKLLAQPNVYDYFQIVPGRMDLFDNSFSSYIQASEEMRRFLRLLYDDYYVSFDKDIVKGSEALARALKEQGFSDDMIRLQVNLLKKFSALFDKAVIDGVSLKTLQEAVKKINELEIKSGNELLKPFSIRTIETDIDVAYAVKKIYTSFGIKVDAIRVMRKWASYAESASDNGLEPALINSVMTPEKVALWKNLEYAAHKAVLASFYYQERRRRQKGSPIKMGSST